VSATEVRAAPVPGTPLPPPPRRLPGVRMLALVVAVLVVHALAVDDTEFSLDTLVKGWHGFVDFFEHAVPDTSWSQTLLPGIEACRVTFDIGLLGTTLAIPGAALAAFCGSRTTTPGRGAYQAARWFMSTLRAVPEVVYALIFVTAVGLGPFPGTLALIVHNVGVMGKLWSEAMDEVDQGPIDALRTNGAGRIQVVLHGVVPAVVPQLVGLLFYRLDVNVRASLVLGLVGAGGVGFLINNSVQYFRFDQMMSYILIVLAMIIIVDQVSATVRRRITNTT
jgi:phosphonate transport system permease protein